MRRCVFILLSSRGWRGKQRVSHNSASLLVLYVGRKQKLNTGRFSIVYMVADGATCPFTTGLFCIPNFRPLKQATGASVQHCVDGWVIKTGCHAGRDKVVNRWAHCFGWLGDAWPEIELDASGGVGKSLFRPHQNS